MKYVVIDERKCELFNEEFGTVEEAIKEGENQWNSMSVYDRKRCEAFYVLESINPDEEAENHFDGNIVKRWK